MGAPWIVDCREEFTLVGTGGPGAPEPNDWPAALVAAALRHGPMSVVLGKRVSTEGRLIAMGEFVVHPKGLHSVGHGLPASAHRFPEEVDGAMDGVAVFPTELIDGLDEPRGAFGLMHWCLESRLRGGQVVAVPDVVWVTGEATSAIDAADIASFIARFGFHPLAPDIDRIAARPELARLRWNVRHFGSPQPFDKYVERGAFHWKAFQENESFRKRAEFLVKLAHQMFAVPAGIEPTPILDIGCGDGLFASLLADSGIPVVGIDNDPIGVGEAQRKTVGSSRPVAFRAGNVYALDEAPASVRGALLFDVIEHLHNPARALAELARVLAPGALLLLSTPEWQFGHVSDPTYHAFEFTMDELQRLIVAQGAFTIERTARIGGVYRDIVVVARRRA